MKDSILEVEGLQVSFLQNEAVSPVVPVIFIHGFPFGKEMWIGQLGSLPAGVQGIAYDVRGFGSSFPGHGFFSIDLFASDLIAFIRNLGLQEVIVCGLSMGGYIALRAFEKEPGLFSGIILADTNASADTNEAKLNRFASIEKIQNGGKEAFAEGFLQKVFSQKTLTEGHDKVSLIRNMVIALPESTLCATQLALASRTDTSHVLDSINIPALIIRGEDDQLMSKEQAQFLHSRIKNSELVEIPDSGHLSNIENPEVFNEVLNEFLRKLR
jgi:pimeloyl-ACP methyl ester carboxylesterase